MDLGASKPTVALTPSKASYTANLPLLPSRPLRCFASSGSPCLHRGSPCLHQGSSSHARPPHVLPSLACVPMLPCTPPPFLLPLRSAISTTEILLCHQDAYAYAPDRAFQVETLISTTKTIISTPKSLCLQVYIYSREASGNFDFRVFIVFLRSAFDPRGVDACRVFPSYAP